MFIKFQTSSPRVKGLCLHAKKPWVLASLQTGEITLWDYRTKVLIEKFLGHIGPVRGIDFNPQQPIFVSGGDDHMIKLWNYHKKDCLFTLIGHEDYIRTVKFHHNHPWIVSASDDQTVCIWNWQSRRRVAILTGHTHYVMSASFHPTEDLLVSVSLDSSMRVWDIADIWRNNCTLLNFKNSDTDLEMLELFRENSPLKYCIEGHSSGINYACFDSKHAYMASCSDDREVKLWSIKGPPMELHSFKGHYNKVTCLVFHRTKDILISASEDRTVKAWDLMKNVCLYTFRKDNCKFWTLAGHPHMDLFAAGHDDGMIVFKLEKERPLFTISDNFLFYLKGKWAYKMNFNTLIEETIVKIESCDTKAVQRMSYNSTRKILLVTIRINGSDVSAYELYYLLGDDVKKNCDDVRYRRTLGLVAIWVNEKHFVVLDRHYNLIVKDYNNEVVETIPELCDDIFYADVNLILIRRDDMVMLYDILSKSRMNQIRISRWKFVIWSPDRKLLSFLYKNEITICNNTLNAIGFVHDSSKIKSGAWSETEVFIYTTINHIKYSLINGDNGIIRTLDVPVYLIKVSDSLGYCLNKEGNLLSLKIDFSECNFKLALINRKYNEIMNFITQEKLVGQAIISYMHQKGFSDLALCYVKDTKSRFLLALECGHIYEALRAAEEIEDNSYWEKLSLVALWIGNIDILEICYQKMKNIDKLVFLYVITGNLGKSRQFYNFKGNDDVSINYYIALLLGDLESRVNILKKSKMPSFAILTSTTHNFNEELTMMDTGVKIDSVIFPELTATTKFLKPLPPIWKNTTNWPLISRSSIREAKCVSSNSTRDIEYTPCVETKEICDLSTFDDSTYFSEMEKLSSTETFFIKKPTNISTCDTDTDASCKNMFSSKTVFTNVTPLLMTTTDDESVPDGCSVVPEKGSPSKATLTIDSVMPNDGKTFTIDVNSSYASYISKSYTSDLVPTAIEIQPSTISDSATKTNIGYIVDKASITTDPIEEISDYPRKFEGRTRNIFTMPQHTLTNFLIKNTGSVENSNVQFVKPKISSRKESNMLPSAVIPNSIQCNATREISDVTNHILIGAFDQACLLLHKQFGIVNFEHFVQDFLTIYSSSASTIQFQAYTTPRKIHYSSNFEFDRLYVNIPYTLKVLNETLQHCYQVTTEGKFATAISMFRHVLLTLPLLKVQTKTIQVEMQLIMRICQEYIVALQLEIHRQDMKIVTSQDARRSCELAVYFTSFGMQPCHKVLALLSAMNTCYKMFNYKMAFQFAGRILGLSPKQRIADRAKKIFTLCEGKRDSFKIIHNDSEMCICGYSYSLMYRKDPKGRCPLCRSVYLIKYKGCICNVCQAAQIGVSCKGFKVCET